MQIIDMHTHTFPDKIAERALDKLSKLSGTVYFTNGTETDLAKSMKEAGVTYSVILPVATSADQVSKINDGVIANAPARLEQGIISFGAMHPDFPSPEPELKRLKEAGIAGIKLHPAYVGVDFDDERFLPILTACAKYDLAVTVHAGIDIGIPEKDYCTTKMVLSVLEKVPGIKLILAHMGGWQCWDKVRRDLADAPIYFDTSFSYGPITPRADRNPAEAPVQMTNEEFVSLCRHLGCEKILFGTDCPWADQKTDVERFLSLPLTEEEKQAILYGNAARILNI